MKNRGRCQHAHSRPRSTLPPPRPKRAASRGKAYPRHPTSSPDWPPTTVDPTVDEAPPERSHSAATSFPAREPQGDVSGRERAEQEQEPARPRGRRQAPREEEAPRDEIGDDKVCGQGSGYHLAPCSSSCSLIWASQSRLLPMLYIAAFFNVTFFHETV